jgi:hypothetical protein
MTDEVAETQTDGNTAATTTATTTDTAAATTTAATETASTTTTEAAATTTALEGGKATTEAAPYWPQDWKTKLVGDDAESKFAKWVARYGSPDAALKGGFEAVNMVRSGQYKKALTDGAKPEDVAAWRAENGVPEKPEDYKITVPAEFTPDDASKKAAEAAVAAYKPVFHELNISQGVAEQLVARHFAEEAAVHQARYEAAQQAMEKYKLDLAREYGRDYETNMRTAAQFISQQVGSDAAGRLFNMVLADGTHLGSHPDFVRFATNSALAFSSDGEIVTGDGGGTAGKSVDEQLREAIDVKFTDPKRYHSEDHQKLVDRLSAAVAKRSNKAA